jgi:hypothetical protein
MNARSSANAVVVVLSQKARWAELGLNSLPAMAIFCRGWNATEHYRKHPFEAIGFAGTDAPGIGAGTPFSEPLAEALFRLASLAEGGINPGLGYASFNPGGSQLGPFHVTPGSLDIGKALPLGEAPKAQQGGCEAVAKRSHFNKSLASLNANNVLQGKRGKNGRFAPLKTLLRPGQGRPKLCLGETYADHFYCLQGCIAGPSLLPILIVARGQLAR